MMGWLVYTAAKPIAKRALKRKAKGVTPGKGGSSKAAIVAGLAALAGALMFWRRRGSDDSTESTGEG